MVTPPRRRVNQQRSIYEPLGLTDLPFSANPVLNPYSTDPRLNGAIYAEGPVQDAITKFERLLIRPQDFNNRVKLASVWAKGDNAQGRGMGKTALLRFFRHRINSDWGETEFEANFSAVVVYASFPSLVDRRWMEQLAWAALVDTCRNGVLDAARVALRRDILSDDQVVDLISTDEGDNWGNLLNPQVLESNGISLEELNEAVEENLYVEGVESLPAKALARGTFEDFLRGLRRDQNLEPYYVPRDTKGLDYSRSLFFNDVVLYLRAAGFAGGYLFVDDIENLTDQMARRHRNEFVKEFGICMVRPGYANTNHSFFSCVLATHQSSAMALAQAWTDAGLSGMAHLSPEAPTSVELPLPTLDQAREIIVAHLDRYRVDSTESGSIKPFTEDGLRELVSKNQRPRDLLANASTTVRRVAEQGNISIDATAVADALSGDALTVSVDYTDGIEGAT